MLAVPLKPDLEKRLAALAERTGRSETFFAQQAIEQHLEDLEDYYLGMKALETSKRRLTPAEVKSELGL
jgi:RHH-type rel operon transcriptional repressor/antitoxin RelB